MKRRQWHTLGELIGPPPIGGAWRDEYVNMMIERAFDDEGMGLRDTLANVSRPLANPDNYEQLLAKLRSGLEVARTFYGAVRFDAFGQNIGKDPTTLQMDAAGEQWEQVVAQCPAGAGADTGTEAAPDLRINIR